MNFDFHPSPQRTKTPFSAILVNSPASSLEGVSFQQIQKYEKGFNRVSAERLQEIANILKVPITFFMPILR